MRVLSIGTDRKLFEDNSSVLERTVGYAGKVEELHMVVFTKKGFTQKTVDNLHLYPTNSLSRFLYIFDAIRIGKFIIENWKLEIKNSGDVVISSQDPFETGLIGYFLKKKFGLPLQLQVHTDFMSKHFASSFLNNLRLKIANFILPKSDGVRVVSEGILESIKVKFPNIKAKMDVLPVYVDVEKMMNTISSKDLSKEFPQFKLIIFMASRLSPEKRIDVALKSFKGILKNFSQAGLVIAGDGAEKNHLINIARGLGLQDKVVFIGWQNDLISYYKTADMFLLTSEYEGYGMTLIEAGASGCPIVTTKVGIANSSVFKNDENSLICSVGDIECITKSINDLASNNWKRELFKRNMQDSIRSSSISKEEYITKYVGLLEKLIG